MVIQNFLLSLACLLVFFLQFIMSFILSGCFMRFCLNLLILFELQYSAPSLILLSYQTNSKYKYLQSIDRNQALIVCHFHWKDTVPLEKKMSNLNEFLQYCQHLISLHMIEVRNFTREIRSMNNKPKIDTVYGSLKK